LWLHQGKNRFTVQCYPSPEAQASTRCKWAARHCSRWSSNKQLCYRLNSFQPFLFFPKISTMKADVLPLSIICDWQLLAKLRNGP